MAFKIHMSSKFSTIQRKYSPSHTLKTLRFFSIFTTNRIEDKTVARLCVCFAPTNALFEPELLIPEIFDTEGRLKSMEPKKSERNIDQPLLSKLRKALINPFDKCRPEIRLFARDSKTNGGVAFHSLILKVSIPELYQMLGGELKYSSDIIRPNIIHSNRIPLGKEKTIQSLRE